MSWKNCKKIEKKAGPSEVKVHSDETQIKPLQPMPHSVSLISFKSNRVNYQ